MWSRVWKFALFLGLFLLFIMLLSLYSQLELPKTTGPYAVGRMMFHWVDTSRPEAMTDESNDFREVMAFVWYPALPGTGADAGYFPNIADSSDALSQSGELAGWQVFALRFVRSNNPINPEPLKDHAPYPVILFSPGNGTNVEFYASIAAEIASHGYVVVGINHPYDVPAVELSDGKVAPYDKAQWLLDPAAHQAYTNKRMAVRIADLLFALNQLEILDSKADSPFIGTLDLDKVAAAGHSLGGIAASEACKVDARFKACLNFDGLQKGGPFSMDETAIPPHQPFLFLTKETELNPKTLQGFESTAESYWVVIHGAAHDSFSDGPVLQPSLLPIPNQADHFMSLIQRYSLAFLDQTLKGRPDSLLARTTEGEAVSVKVFRLK